MKCLLEIDENVMSILSRVSIWNSGVLSRSLLKVEIRSVVDFIGDVKDSDTSVVRKQGFAINYNNYTY